MWSSVGGMREIARRRLVAITALSVAAVLGLGTITASAADRRAKPARSTKVPFQRGVTFGDWGPAAYDPNLATQALLRLKRNYKVKWVTFFYVWMQADGNSTTIFPGRETASQARLINAIQYARQIGLKVILRPYIDRNDGGWRGELTPTSVDAWFASYRNFILPLAKLAKTYGVRGFIIGSELKTLSPYASYWKNLVAAARRRFKGFITYQANWDEYRRVSWWNVLDAIDISAYFPLNYNNTYSVRGLMAGWRGGAGPNWFAQIKALHKKFRLPVFFGELGYRTVAGGAIRPWDTKLPGAYSEEAQRQAYQATFKTWFKVPWFRGFDWWYFPQNYFVNPPRPGTKGGGHVPAPPAAKTIKRWYRKKR
jgi:hypothetical protein